MEVNIMMNKKLITLFGVVFSFLLVLSCGMKRDSLGSQDKIIIIADSTQWIDIESDVLAALEQFHYTPQPEPVFNLLHKNPQDLKTLIRFPNMLLVGSLDQDNDMSDLLKKMLSEDALMRVQEDSAFLFNKNDPWARNQLLALAVAKDTQTLKKNLAEHGDRIFNLFDENMSANVFRSLYLHFEQDEINKSLMKQHGWNVRVQHDYYVAVDSAEIRYVWLRRFNPQRWLSVYWEPVEDPSILSKEWMLQKRAEVIEPFYDGDYVYEDSTIQVQEKIVDFNNRYAIRLDGVWQNEKHVMGGPFRSYAFYEESDGRLYLIDLAVYAPGKRKNEFMRQLDGIASTFKVKSEK
jgi:hypothetical protein